MREIRIPKLGLDTADCQVARWLVQPGQKVAKGAPLLEVETEKALIPIEADSDGVLAEIRAQSGQTVPVGAVVGLLEEAR